LFRKPFCGKGLADPRRPARQVSIPKEAKDAEKRAKKTEKEAEKEAEKQAKKAEKEAKKAKKEAKNAETAVKKAVGKSTRGRKRKTSPAVTDVPASSNKSPRIGEASSPWEFQTAWVNGGQQIAPVARMI
jgi:hypothetical protein